MKTWARALTLWLVCAAGFAAPVRAQGAAKLLEQAETYNAAGKKLVRQLELEGAAEQFRKALHLVRDPRYAFNLCYTLEKSGHFQEAQKACREVASSDDQRLARKATELLVSIDKEVAAHTPPPAPAKPTPAEPTGAQPPTPTPRPLAATGPGVYPGQPPTDGAVYGQPFPMVRTKTVSYGSQVAYVDAASLAVLLLSAGSESEGGTGLGVTGLILGGSVVHLFHGNGHGAMMSIGSRIGLPFAGALLFASSCAGDGFDCFDRAAAGAVVGYGTALFFDWLVFAKKTETTYASPLMLQPTIDLTRGGATLGLRLDM